MPVFEAKRRVQVPADVAFEVAADVGSYKEFLPLLQRSDIIGARTKTPEGETFRAELVIAFAKLGLKEAFVSSVSTNTAARSVKAVSTDGPFRKVETDWTITPAQNGSDVHIRIDYAFRNPLIQLAASGLMDVVISKVIAEFEARGQAVFALRQSLKLG